MRVAYDEQVFIGQRHGGISRYFVGLIEALRADALLGIEPELGWSLTINEHAVSAGLGRAVPQLGPREAAAAVCFAVNAPARRRARHAPVLHHTHYLSPFLRGRITARRVVTVHDMIPELLPELFTDGNPHFAKREYVRRASLIVCPSESTARDLVAVYGEPAAPVVVVPHGVGSSWFEPTTPPRGTPPYLVFVGPRGRYKDWDVAVRALTLLDASLELICVGGGALTPEEKARLTGLGLQDRVRQRAATDAELASLYSGAVAFVYPSRHEGFGLTTLEAMAAGCPVVLARGSSHIEVGGTVARYFEPGDEAALAGRIQELGGGAIRDSLIAQGVERARSFSWHHTAALTASAYLTLG